ncbi:MAG: IS110 family transposase [Methanobacteriota archaeon]
MRPVVAIDAHKDSCTYVVRRWDETVAGPTRIPTAEDALRRLAAAYPDHDFVVEVCNVHEWMIDLFREVGVHAMAVIPPKKGPVGKKSDDDDATRLARKHQAGELVEVFIAAPGIRALRDLVRQHEFLKKKRTAFNNNLKHALIRSGFQPRNLDGAGRAPGVYSEEGRAQVVKRFPQLETVYAVIDVIDERMDVLKRVIEAKGKGIAEVQLLRSVPGFGPIISLALYTEIAEIDRFDKAERLVRYFGLDPVHASSGDKHWDGHRISKKGISFVRGILAQGAWSHVNYCRESDITTNFHRLVGRGKTEQQALMMVMRRLVKAAYWMLTEKREFTMTGPAR